MIIIIIRVFSTVALFIEYMHRIMDCLSNSRHAGMGCEKMGALDPWSHGQMFPFVLGSLLMILFLLWWYRQHEMLHVAAPCTSLHPRWWKWRAGKNRQLHIQYAVLLLRKDVEMDSPAILPIHIQALWSFSRSSLTLILISFLFSPLSLMKIFFLQISFQKLFCTVCLIPVFLFTVVHRQRHGSLWVKLTIPNISFLGQWPD